MSRAMEAALEILGGREAESEGAEGAKAGPLGRGMELGCGLSRPFRGLG